MPQLQIHPDFKLQNQSFADYLSLLSYVKKALPDSFSFLKNLFDESDSIIVFTSGSTGTPKEIPIAKTALLYSARATQEFFNLPAQTKALHCLSTNFIAGKMMWVRAIYLGWHLDVVTANSDPMEQTKATYDFAAMVPLQVENSLKDLNRIEKLIIGGAAISRNLVKELEQKECMSFQTYGMTETITHIAVKRIEKTKKNFYKCLLGIEISQDKRDCLQIKAAHISNNIFTTNDLVRLVSKVEFEWLGRFDNVINSGGIKFFPEQIENKIAPIISKACIIFGIPDDRLGQKVCLLIEAEQAIPNIKNLLAHSDLTRFEVPKEIYYLHSFVRTKNSKINRNDTISLINK